MTKRFLICAPLALLIGGCQSTAQEPSLDEVKAVAERYRDVKVAIAEGYTTDNKCVTAEMLGHPASLGVMGLHYVRRDVLGLPDKPTGRVNGTGTHTDFRKPAMLVYEPQPDGSLELVAVENLVFASAWHETAGNEEPPKFHGRTYPLLRDDPATKVDEAHGWEPHYEQHLWVFRDNPNGAYAPFNPNLTCRYNKPPPAPVALDATLPGQTPAKQSASVVPKPRDQAQLDRMILAGYTPHGEHMHPPGVNKCPLSKDSEAVM